MNILREQCTHPGVAARTGALADPGRRQEPRMVSSVLLAGSIPTPAQVKEGRVIFIYSFILRVHIRGHPWCFTFYGCRQMYTDTDPT